MTKLKKFILRFLLVFIIIIPIAAFAHFIIFPQQTRCILIGYSNFTKEERLYFNPATPPYKIDTLSSIIKQASLRISSFWGEKKSDPKFIYCYNEDDYKKYGSEGPAPATTHFKLGSYIVISHNGVDLDIVSHEMSHAEFNERAGFYNITFKVPIWFNEGLAMQNDYRNYYSEDTLKARSGNYKQLPDLFKIGTHFYDGPPEQVMLNFMTARYVVKRWYTKEKLGSFINCINSGKSFEQAFGK